VDASMPPVDLLTTLAESLKAITISASEKERLRQRLVCCTESGAD